MGSATLNKFGDAFRYQLIMAIHLEHQAAHLEELRRDRPG
jgi:hypothetical protein